MAFKELNLIQGSKEWLEARRHHLTATEAAHVKSGFTSLYTLIGQKRGVIPVEDISDKPPVKEGKFFEPLVRQELARQLPKLLAEGETDFPQPCCESVEEPFFMASLDGYSAVKNVVIEVKNIFSHAKSNYEDVCRNGLNAAVPLKYGYYYQIQWQLFVTGAPMALLAFHWSPDGETFHPENIRIIKVMRDDKAIAELTELGLKIKAILKQNLEVKPGPGDTVYLSKEVTSSVEPFLDEYRFVDTAYQQAVSTVNTLKKKRSELTDRLSAVLLTGDAVKVVGAGIAISRIERQGGFDVEQMIKDGIISQETAEKYRKASSFSTRITIS